jgi:lipopolysaccharide export system protein LptC
MTRFRIISSIILVLVLAALTAWKIRNENEPIQQPQQPSYNTTPTTNDSQFNLR